MFARGNKSNAAGSAFRTRTGMESEGCEHYRRRANLVASCCSRMHCCRFCHDNKTDHDMDRKAVTYIICAVCSLGQTVKKSCDRCGVVFGRYACLECRLFDDDLKGQFHCKDCGLCRTGGRHNFFHCPTCNFCLPLYLRGNHKCIRDSSRTPCNVCLEDLHTSIHQTVLLKCGHVLHENCYYLLLEYNREKCPSCSEKLALAGGLE